MASITLPRPLQRAFSEIFGEEYKEIIKTGEKILIAEAPQSQNSIYLASAPPWSDALSISTSPKTVGGKETGYRLLSSEREPRPEDALSLDYIELMMRNGQVAFATALKVAPIRAVFRNDRSWTIEGGSKPLREIISANLRDIFPKHIDDWMLCLPYGASFHELVWKQMTGKELGIKRTAHGNPWWVLHETAPVYPGSVEVIRKKNGTFGGFVQIGFNVDDVTVGVDRAFVLTYNKRWRSIWGQSYYEPMFVFWYWYEVMWRAFLHYMQRMGQPVIVVKAPQRAKIKNPKTGKWIDAMVYALQLASDIARSNAVSLPSDVDPETNKPLWSVEYLSDQSRAAPFIDALKLLGTMILRAGLLADRVATQETQTGSYNLASIHYIMTRLDDERVLDMIVQQVNRYLIPKYVWYNGGLGKEPMPRLVTEALDIEEKTRAFQLLMKLADMKAPDLKRVDVERLLEAENIPMRSMDEYREHLKELEEIKKEAGVQPPPFAQQKKDQGTQEQGQPEEQSDAGKEDLARLKNKVAKALSQGHIAPLFLTESDLEILAEMGFEVRRKDAGEGESAD